MNSQYQHAYCQVSGTPFEQGVQQGQDQPGGFGQVQRQQDACDHQIQPAGMGEGDQRRGERSGGTVHCRLRGGENSAAGIGQGLRVLLGDLMCKLSGGKINPLIGSAGVSAVPMAARVSQKVGQAENPSNFLLMHAMGPNVAGVIGSAVAAGVFISMFG